MALMSSYYARLNKRVEEFFLNPLLARQKLNVVNQKHIGLTIFPPKSGQLIVLDAVNVFVGELLGGKVSDPRSLSVGHHVVPNGVQQMRLAQTNPAMQEQRVVRFPRLLGDRQRGGMGKVVIVSDDKRVEIVLRTETQFLAEVVSFGRPIGDFRSYRARIGFL